MRGLILALLFSQSLIAAEVSTVIQYDKNVPTHIRKGIEKDLNILSIMKFNGQSPLHKTIFGSASYRLFFHTRIQKVGLDDSQGVNFLAYVNSKYSDKMFLGKNYVEINMPQVARLHILYHEARHTELSKGSWSHIPCPVPFLDENGKDVVGRSTGVKLAGLMACDDTELGAYALGGILLNNIQRFCANCTEKAKLDAEIFSKDVIYRITDRNAKEKLINDYKGN